MEEDSGTPPNPEKNTDQKPDYSEAETSPKSVSVQEQSDQPSSPSSAAGESSRALPTIGVDEGGSSVRIVPTTVPQVIQTRKQMAEAAAVAEERLLRRMTEQNVPRQQANGASRNCGTESTLGADVSRLVLIGFAHVIQVFTISMSLAYLSRGLPPAVPPSGILSGMLSGMIGGLSIFAAIRACEVIMHHHGETYEDPEEPNDPNRDQEDYPTSDVD